jgi:hypothetical protein
MPFNATRRSGGLRKLFAELKAGLPATPQRSAAQEGYYGTMESPLARSNYRAERQKK